MFYESKSITSQDIAGTMKNQKRRAEIDLKLVGIIWIDNMNTSNFEYKDLADNECEQLMENIEEVLRTDPTLGGNVLFSHPTDTTYHTFSVSEDAHMRAGIINFKLTVLY
jgi:hypothetical protein